MPGHASSTAIMGDCKRRGAWHVPPRHAAFALMGSVSVTRLPAPGTPKQIIGTY